ncbi:LysR family transcriptional regulator [Oscillibacter sp. GMB15532]|uniref:LysR family transcriptional regulator n=1 Tax=Oscillibacter sp. GMB15532 TaxID=3230022 RepID=UPI0034E049B2
MSSRRMSYFIAIAEIQNISKAAQALHVSQPSLSQYLNRLEEGLGVKLLDRTCTPLRLTEEGKLYLEYVREVTEVERRFENRLQARKKATEKTLSIGIPTQLTPMLFRKFVQGFLHANSEKQLTIRDGTSLSVREELFRGEVDVAFFHTQVPEDARLISFIIQEERLFLACNRNSSLVRGRTGTREHPLLLTKADFPRMAEMLFLIPPKTYFINSVIWNHLKEIGLSPKKILELPALSSIGDCLLEPENNGISLLADFSIAGMKSIDEITFVKIEGHDLRWYLTMSYLADTPLSPSGYSLWKYVSGRR